MEDNRENIKEILETLKMFIGNIREAIKKLEDEVPEIKEEQEEEFDPPYYRKLK